MGLDALEIIMETEEHFGISLPNEELEVIFTVGDLVDAILLRIRASHTEPCQTLPAFRSLQTLVQEVAEDSKLRIRPSLSLVKTLTPKERCQLWSRLGELFHSLPRKDLRRPTFVRRLLLASTAALWLAT